MRFSVMWFLCPVCYTGSEGVFACVFRLTGLALSRKKQMITRMYCDITDHLIWYTKIMNIYTDLFK